MFPGEIKIEGLGKRYWFRSLDEGFADGDGLEEDAEDDPDIEEGGNPLSSFRRPMSEVWALRDISLHIKPGERVGIIGANGSGKSTLIRILSRALPPSEGIVEGAGIVLPFGTLINPLSLNVSGCDNLRMLARLLNIPQEHLEERLPKIVDFSELGALANEKVSRYSANLFTRLSAAMALFVDAAIYLIDDNLKVGDEAYRLKFHSKFAEVLQRPVTLCYASNKLPVIREYCSRVILLDGGRIVADGEANKIIAHFLTISDQAIDLGEIETVPDEQQSAEDEKQSAEQDLRSRNLAPSIPIAGNRELLIGWAEQVERAEKAWESLLRRRREKDRLGGEKKVPTAAKLIGESTRGTVHSLNCMNDEGEPVSWCLPGEAIFIEFIVETFEGDTKIEVKLELHRLPKVSMLVLVSEPLVPLVADSAGRYLFQVEVPGDLVACYNECTSLKLVARIALGRPNSEERDMMTAVTHFDVRGDVRFQFDEQRFFGGEPATSVIQPAPAFVKPPAEIEGFEEAGEGRRPLTVWEMYNRPAAVRPRLAWMIYRVLESEAEGREELLHEDA